MRRPLRGSVAVADRIRVGAPVGVFAVPVLSGVAPLAFAAAYIMFDEDEIAFLEALAAGEFNDRACGGGRILLVHHPGGSPAAVMVWHACRAADSHHVPLFHRHVPRAVRS